MVPISGAGKVEPHRLTNPHGTYFGHTQNWPSDTFHHMVHSSGFQPKQSKMAPWIPTLDGYEEPFAGGKPNLDMSDRRQNSYDMSVQNNLDMDMGNYLETHNNARYETSENKTIDQTMQNSVSYNQSQSSQTSVDNFLAPGPEFEPEQDPGKLPGPEARSPTSSS